MERIVASPTLPTSVSELVHGCFTHSLPFLSIFTFDSSLFFDEEHLKIAKKLSISFQALNCFMFNQAALIVVH